MTLRIFKYINAFLIPLFLLYTTSATSQSLGVTGIVTSKETGQLLGRVLCG